MKLKQLRNIYFDADNQLLASAMKKSVSHIRNLIADDREAIRIIGEDRFVLAPKTPVYIDVKEPPCGKCDSLPIGRLCIDCAAQDRRDRMDKFGG